MQDRFKQILQEKNMTANRFAERIEVNASAVSHILTGRSKPSFDVLNKISQTFPEINMNWLISGNGEMYGQAAPSRPSAAESLETAPASRAEAPAPAVPLPGKGPVPAAGKTVRKIVLFYDDGTYEAFG